MKARVKWNCVKCGTVEVWTDIESLTQIKCPVCGTPMHIPKAQDVCHEDCRDDCAECVEVK